MVTMLVRGDTIDRGMSHYLVAQIEATANVEVRLCTEVAEVHGDDHLQRITVRDRAGETTDIAAAGLFVFIGAAPNTAWLDGVVGRDERGFVLAGSGLPVKRMVAPDGTEREPAMFETSVPGVFVVGDVRAGSIKRVASAVGQGSIAVALVHQYLGTA